MLSGTDELISELKKAWEKTSDPQVLQVLMDAFSEAGGEGGEELLQYLEYEWKRARLPLIERQLTQVYGVFGKVPKDEFQRLKDEVELRVRREQVEELSSEHGNLNRAPWRVKVLTEIPPARSGGAAAPATGAPPDFVTPDGLDLWVRDSIYTPKGLTQRQFTMDYPPEYLQSQLEREYGDDAEFVTVYDGGDTEYLADAKTGDIYRNVESSVMGERECPYATWDPYEREDRRHGIVIETDTWFGEHPGKWCCLCEAEIGDEHGHIYLGNDALESVYLKLVAEPLRSTVNEPHVEEEIRRAFERFIEREGLTLDDFDTFFEHGQWYVRTYQVEEDNPEQTFSVVDVEVNGGQHQFDFEEL